MILFRRSDSRLTMPTRCCSSSCSGTRRPSSFTAPAIAVKRLADFVRDGRGETAQRRHAFLGGYFLFQTLQVREVLEIEYVAGGAALSRAKRRDRYADETLLAIGRQEIDFAPLGKLAIFGDIARKPERGPHVLHRRSLHTCGIGFL